MKIQDITAFTELQALEAVNTFKKIEDCLHHYIALTFTTHQMQRNHRNGHFSYFPQYTHPSASSHSSSLYKPLEKLYFFTVSAIDVGQAVRGRFFGTHYATWLCTLVGK